MSLINSIRNAIGSGFISLDDNIGYSDYHVNWRAASFSVSFGGVTYRYAIAGDLMHVILFMSTAAQPSGGTTLATYLPAGTGKVAKSTQSFKTSQAVNNSSAASDVHGQTIAGRKRLNFFTTALEGAWSASNNKKISFEALIEVEDGLDLLSLPTRYENNPIIPTPETHKNTCPSGMVQDPTDSSKFLFYVGEFVIEQGSVDGRIRLMQGDHSDYFDISTDLGLVIEPSESYDVNGCRFGQAVTVRNEIWLYYVGIDASYKWRICLWKSSDGRTGTKHGVVLDFNNDDEKSISDPAIWIEGDKIHMLYTAWSGGSSFPPGANNPGKSSLGLKYSYGSVQAGGLSFTKTGTYVIPIGSAGQLDDGNVEGCQLYKWFNTYVAIYNCKRDSTEWYVSIASVTGDINQEFTKTGQIYFQGTGGAQWDGAAIATILINPFDPTIGYYQGWGTPTVDIPIGALRMNGPY